MPTCYLLQRAASRVSDTEHDSIEVSCSAQPGGTSAVSGAHRPRSYGAGALLQRRDEFDALRDHADCRSDQCDDVKNVTNIGSNSP